MKNIQVWKPIEFNKKLWEETDCSTFYELEPSWIEKREEFKNNNIKEYEEFLNRLKRQHAIETGVVEKLYDISEGITQTFIKDGFIESLISHNDTNISSKQLLNYLKSHFDAMDFVFDIVKQNRPLTKSFILELHQLITQHQDYIEAIDSNGKLVKTKLLKGEFKKLPNNPKREDGTVFEYCPPLKVNDEIEKLIEIYNKLKKEKIIHPIKISAWFHHAFTQIHPFQDGNGRIARLLASLILIKNQLFPLNISREEKNDYIKALEKADNNEPNDLVVFFCKIQRKNIENALNIQITQNSLEEVAKIFKERIEKRSKKEKIDKEKKIQSHRNQLFDYIYKIIGEIQSDLFNVIPKEEALINAKSQKPDEKHFYYYTRQIAEYAKENEYFFNKTLPRGWFRLTFDIKATNKRYDIIISIHHFGYSDSVIAIGSFIEFIDESNEERVEQTIPLNIKPYTLSLEQSINEITIQKIKNYLTDIVQISLSIIVNEI
jgi:Fic family protein